MSSSLTTPKENSEGADRRACPRETLNWLALVFFDRDNWGKVINLSETGMAVEFSQLPAARVLTPFVLEAMSPQSSQPGGELPISSIQTDGEIVWTRDSEKTAGVLFADSSGRTRNQIKQWLSFESLPQPLPESSEPTNDLLERGQEADSPESLQVPLDPASTLPHIELPDPVLTHNAETEISEPVAPAVDQLFSSVHAERLPLEAPIEPLAESSPSINVQQHAVEPIPHPPLPVVRAAPHPVAGKAHRQDSELPRPRPAKLPAPKASLPRGPRVVRVVLLSFAGFLAAIAVFAALAMIWVRRDRLAALFIALKPSLSEPAAPAGAQHPAPAPAKPFQVQVRDANNRRWLLTFDQSAAPGKPAPLSSPSAAAAASAKNPPPKELDSAAQRPWLSNFKLAAPLLTRGAPTASPENAPPAVNTVDTDVPARAAALSGDPFAGILANTPKPAPAVPQTLAAAPHATRVGGQIAWPRLISSVPPEYPSLARSRRLEGDVTLDALIDATGKVSDVTLVSGPALLQGAAMDSVRRWKYEPARLNDQPIPIHLQVTVKFRAR